MPIERKQEFDAAIKTLLSDDYIKRSEIMLDEEYKQAELIFEFDQTLGAYMFEHVKAVERALDHIKDMAGIRKEKAERLNQDANKIAEEKIQEVVKEMTKGLRSLAKRIDKKFVKCLTEK